MRVDPSDKVAIYEMFKSQLDSISKGSKYTFSSPRRQNFSLPPDVISHILNKPISPEGLKKLFRTCKYFFSKKQILVFDQDGIFFETELLSIHVSKNKVFNLNKKVLFWFTRSLQLLMLNSSIELNMIYRSSLTKLSICDSNLTFAEFEMLASNYSKIKELCLVGSRMEYWDGTNVPIDAIFQRLPMVEKIKFDNTQETFAKETLEKLSKITFMNPLEHFTLRIRSISPSFDPSLLCYFLKKNMFPTLAPQSCAMIFIYCENGRIIKESIDASNKEIFETGNKHVDIITFAR